MGPVVDVGDGAAVLVDIALVVATIVAVRTSVLLARAVADGPVVACTAGDGAAGEGVAGFAWAVAPGR